jgi:hypothetical protein
MYNCTDISTGVPFSYIMCNKSALIIIGKIYKDANHNLDYGAAVILIICTK